MNCLERDVQSQRVFRIFAWCGLKGNVYVLLLVASNKDNVLDAGGAFTATMNSMRAKIASQCIGHVSSRVK